MVDELQEPGPDRSPMVRMAAALESFAAQQAKPKSAWETWSTPAAILLSVIGLIVTITVASCQAHSDNEHFDRTQRTSNYSDIVDGLGSASVAVQVNSMRRLVQYVRETDNFEDSDAQDQAATNAAATLAAFIQQKSLGGPGEGLSDYRDPQPVVMPRALSQLLELTGRRDDPGSPGEKTFPGLDLDLARGNFHGVPFADFAPEGSFYAVGSDWRGAIVTGWDLSHVEAPDLRNAFFTCANLQQSDLGSADLAAADLTGANLRGADLSGVRNLTRQQLRGALVGDQTWLPSYLSKLRKPVPQPGWGVEQVDGRYVPSARCRALMDDMTDLPAGAGYSSRVPCSPKGPWGLEASAKEQDAVTRVCALRLGRDASSAPDGVAETAATSRATSGRVGVSSPRPAPR